MYNSPVFSTIKLLQVATVVLVQQWSCFDTQHVFYKLYTFLYRDKSGGGKAVPQQHGGNYVLQQNIFCNVYLQLYIAYLYMV